MGTQSFFVVKKMQGVASANTFGSTAMPPFRPELPFDPKPVRPEEAAGPRQNQGWNPYQNNGGSVCAIARPDYCVIAGDTRMVKGYGIASRGLQRIFKLTDKCVLATSGFQADGDYLVKMMRTRLVMYKHQTGDDNEHRSDCAYAQHDPVRP